MRVRFLLRLVHISPINVLPQEDTMGDKSPKDKEKRKKKQIVKKKGIVPASTVSSTVAKK